MFIKRSFLASEIGQVAAQLTEGCQQVAARQCRLLMLLRAHASGLTY